MTWFLPKPEPFEAKQWPHMGVTALFELVGADNVIVAKDGTIYVIVASGHPQRVEPGWWVCRHPNREISVVSGTWRQDWQETPPPERPEPEQ